MRRNLVLSLLMGLLVWVGLPEVASGKEILQHKRILYVPLDNRPVCLDYVVDTFKTVPVQLAVAPREYLSYQSVPGDTEAIWQWLRAQASSTDVMVIAADSLVYGGLVPSRRHEIGPDVLNERVDRFRELKEVNPALQIYLFTTIMRTPRAASGGTEPDYYEIWGPQIFRLTQLLDLQDQGLLTPENESELNALVKVIPEKVKFDWFDRRTANRRVNERWIASAKEGLIDYLVLCRDDSAQLSQSQREWRYLKPQTANLSPTRFHAFPGTDEVGMVLMTRAVNDLTFRTPQIGVVYAPGIGGATVASYEDQPVQDNIAAHIYALGGFPAIKLETADLILLVNTPEDGRTLEASHTSNQEASSNSAREVVRQAVRWSKLGKTVAIGDIAYGNGADRSLMYVLEERNLLYDIDAYAGWNTAGNSLGYAMSQGLLAPRYFTKETKDRLLTVRYLDDWGYQAVVRNKVNQKVIYPSQINGAALGSSYDYVQAWIELEMKDFSKKHLGKNGELLVGIRLPWMRMFEIEPLLKAQKK